MSALGYSYRKASTGSSLAARTAGESPLNTPMTIKMPLERRSVAAEIRKWISPLPEASSYIGPRKGSESMAPATPAPGYLFKLTQTGAAGFPRKNPSA